LEEKVNKTRKKQRKRNYLRETYELAVLKLEVEKQNALLHHDLEVLVVVLWFKIANNCQDQRAIKFLLSDRYDVPRLCATYNRQSED